MLKNILADSCSSLELAVAPEDDMVPQVITESGNFTLYWEFSK